MHVKKLTFLLCLGLLFALTVSFGVTNLYMATGGTSGTYYPFGGVVAQVIGQRYPEVRIRVQSTGASAANIRLIAEKEVDIALVQNDVMHYAYTGTVLFKSGKITNFSTLATIYTEVCQLVVRAESGISSIADLKGRRVSVGDAGSGVEANALQILEAYGISFNDISRQNLSFAESASALKDRKIDAFFVTSGIPNTAIIELASTNAISLIPIDPEKITYLETNYPFYVKFTIPADTYKNMSVPADTVAVKATFIVRSDLSEDLVYNITKAMFEGLADIAAAHAKGKEFTLEGAVKGVSVPFHKGAEKYYREVGVIK
jgi:TRAP transporter TAXI family solute receptor